VEKENLVSPIEEGDIIFFSSGNREDVHRILGNLRVHIGNKYGLVDKSRWDILWIVDFPLMEWDEEEGRFVSLHHPFTSPRDEDIVKIEQALNTDDLEERKKLINSVKARAYDLVLNGEEIGGGSIRIHRRDVQRKIFKLLNIDEEEAKEKFGFLLEALKRSVLTGLWHS